MKTEAFPGSWCEIHCDRISRNLELARGLVPEGRQFCVVLKADAYGHGISKVAPLAMEQGVSSIGITSNAEAQAVRRAGFGGRLIRLRAATPAEMLAALPDRVEEQVGSLLAARALETIARDGRVRAHLALNAEGMSRDGLEIGTRGGRGVCLEILERLRGQIVGICTHFPNNDPAALGQSSALFEQQVRWVCDSGGMRRSDLIVHAGSSLTLISGVPVHTDMYRCGAILYGILKPELGFRPTMDLKARIVSIGDYPKGNTVGYDRACALTRDRRLACISIGYANGIARASHDRGAVVIRGALAPVMGKISMNTIVADVSELQAAAVGDEVCVFGGNPAAPITPPMAERQFGTIMADLYTDWGGRNHRIYRGCNAPR